MTRKRSDEAVKQGATDPVYAFILVNTEIGQVRNVHDSIKKIKGVQWAKVVTGTYDVIAYVVVDAVTDLFRVVTAIQNIGASPQKGVKATQTAFVIRDTP